MDKKTTTLRLNAGETHISLKATTAVREYKGYTYRGGIEDQWTFMLGSEPLIAFHGEDNIKLFIDSVETAVEKYAMKALRLHLTGCMRCRRTSLGRKNDPCNRGIPLFLSAKKNAEIVVRTMVTAIESGKEPSSSCEGL